MKSIERRSTNVHKFTVIANKTKGLNEPTTECLEYSCPK